MRAGRERPFAMTGLGYLVVFDLEFCAPMRNAAPFVVQIGAVKLRTEPGLPVARRYCAYVRPPRGAKLSKRFTSLTGIDRRLLAARGVPFGAALSRFSAFCAGADCVCSYGDDFLVLQRDCRRRRVPLAIPRARYADIESPLLAAVQLRHRPDSSALPAHVGLPRRGRPHDALADATALADVLRVMVGRGYPLGTLVPLQRSLDPAPA